MNDLISECAALLEKVKHKKPLVHHITNYVTVNDCANITLAIGASPVMADAIEEAADIAAIASAVVLNIGTLNNRTVESMLAAGGSANERGIPVIFDPVGAGASAFRNETARRLLSEVRMDVIRGNISEIRSVAGLSSNTKGVDASEADTFENAAQIARELASKRGCVVVITGAVDIISDGARTAEIRNGHSDMSRVTGTGCMCTSLIGSLCGAAGDAFHGAAAAVLCMGVAGELAHEKAGADGSGSFRNAVIDAVSGMDADILKARGKIDEIS